MLTCIGKSNNFESQDDLNNVCSKIWILRPDIKKTQPTRKKTFFYYIMQFASKFLFAE